MQVDVRGGPGRFKGVPGAISAAQTPKSTICGYIAPSPSPLKDPGVLLKDPGVLLKGPGVLLKGPGVLLKGPGELFGRLEIADFGGLGGRNRPRDPLRSTGPAPHINLHQKSAPETNSKATSRRFPVGQKIMY